MLARSSGWIFWYVLLSAGKTINIVFKQNTSSVLLQTGLKPLWQAESTFRLFLVDDPLLSFREPSSAQNLVEAAVSFSRRVFHGISIARSIFRSGRCELDTLGKHFGIHPNHRASLGQMVQRNPTAIDSCSLLELGHLGPELLADDRLRHFQQSLLYSRLLSRGLYIESLKITTQLRTLFSRTLLNWMGCCFSEIGNFA